MSIKLTEKRQRWVKNRNVVLKGSKLNYNAGIQQRYVRSLERLVKQMATETNRQVVRFFKGEIAEDFFKEQEALTMDASVSSQARILMNYLSRTFTQLFNSRAEKLADNMVEQTAKVSASNTHQSLKELSGGVSLKTSVVSEGQTEVAKALISENVSLIKSIPQQYFVDVTGSVMRSITTGRGLQDLVPDLKRYEGICGRRAKNIALDQTRKAYASINRQKLLDQNVTQFEWLHSGGSANPRESHIMLDGKIFNFKDIDQQQASLGVPEKDRGYPGEAINCRCTLIPVVTFGDEN